MSGVVVLGVGNVLMGDEGAGVRCIEALDGDRRIPRDVKLIDGGTSTHELLEDVENLDLLVIVDAVRSGQPAGTIVSFEGDRIPSAFSNKLSPHQHGINDLLAELELLGRAPKHVHLFGVEPARVALGFELSPEVEGALPTLCRRVAELVRHRH
jgi:hydrogenase maturation protease